MADDVDRYPAGVPCWIDTTHADVPGAADFYGSLFGWDLRESGGRLIASLDGQDVAGIGGPPGGPAAPGWTTYIRVDDVDAAVGTVRRAGGRVLAEPADVGDAGRTATVADPAGAELRLWQAGGHRGAGTVNADGAWNWSNLQTPDPVSAVEFYGAVFGWEELSLGPMSMWVLPGYGEVLDRLYPIRREQHADDGVPDGFADCIGWILPSPDGAARWTVTFAVADTDKTVEQAVALGATVRVPPYTAPPVRAAELTDPQGVDFNINTYQPDA